MAGWAERRAERLGNALEDFDRNEDAPEAAWSAMLAARPPAAAAGVDLSAVTAAVPDFDGQAFLAVARESYFTMRNAWEQRTPRIAEDVATDAVFEDLERVCADDYSKMRRHVLPGVEIHAAEITRAEVQGTVVTLVVRMHLIGKDHYVDESFNIIEGDDAYHHWDEDWTFERDTSVDESGEDAQRALIPEDLGGWDFPHQGWNVAAIARVTPE